MFFNRASHQVGRVIGSKAFSSKRKAFWGKLSPLYLTYIVVGAIGFEFFYGKFSESVWIILNQGVSIYFYFLFIYLYHMIHIFLFF